MLLREWRNQQEIGCAEMARRLGIGDSNPSAAGARLESGSRPVDADMVERIARLTGGAVTAADMHAVRLAWLKANRPEKFCAGNPSSAPSGHLLPQGEKGEIAEAAE